ncbi:MAG: hypothetical protein ACE5FB_03950 [Candidatus Binatia bacterium]
MGQGFPIRLRSYPNVMAAAVSCMGCHDFSTKHSRKAVGQQCLACHDEAYTAFVEEWTTGFDKQMDQPTKALKQAEAALRKSHRAGRTTPGAEGLMKDTPRALALAKGLRGVHNPDAADALLEAAGRGTEEAVAQIGRQ